MPEEDELLEPEESEETIPDELEFADEAAETEEVSLAGEADETFEEFVEEGEATELEEDFGEETVEDGFEEELPEEAGYIPAVAEPEGPPPKPTSNVYTMMLVLAFLFFAVTIWLAGAELNEFYGFKGFGLLE